MGLAVWLILIPLVIGAVTLGLRMGLKPLRDMRAHPDYRSHMQLSFGDRWLYGRLARSEQPITDPEESRRAEIAARLTVTQNRSFYRRGHLAYLGVALAVGVILPGFDRGRLVFTFLVVLMFVVSYFWMRRTETQIHRTATLNGWDLDA